MSKKTIVMHITIPILLAILSFFISTTLLFRIPDPMGGLHPSTYIFAIRVFMFVLGVSAIVSAILFIGKKKK